MFLPLDLEYLRTFWPYEESILEQFISAKRKYKAGQTITTKLAFKDARTKIKPFLTTLLKSVREKEKKLVSKQLRRKGVIDVSIDDEKLKQLKAVSHILKKI